MIAPYKSIKMVKSSFGEITETGAVVDMRKLIRYPLLTILEKEVITLLNTENMNLLTEDQITKAKLWYQNHSYHVRNIITDELIVHAYPPSEEDVDQPNIWKPSHWVWFLQNFS